MPIEGIVAREATALIWTYLGWKHEVCPLMQRLSHSSRAYLINAKGLPGFLVPIDIPKMVTNLHKKGLLVEATKWHEIDLQSLSNDMQGKSKSDQL